MHRYIYKINFGIRVAVFVAFAVAVLGLVFGLSPARDIAVDYYLFADRRRFLGIPNFANVTSNILFLVAAAFGWWGVSVSDRRNSERCLWGFFYVCVFLIGIGSVLFYWNSTPASLMVGRIPIALASGLLFCVLIVERLRGATGWWLGAIWLVVAFSSIWWWWLSRLLYAPDVRLYAFVSFYPVIGILLLMALFPARYVGDGWLVAALFLYLVSRLVELYDLEIFIASGQIMSGHLMKNVIAAIATCCLVRYCHLPRIIPSSF